MNPPNSPYPNHLRPSAMHCLIVVVFFLLVALGCWQIKRYHEKIILVQNEKQAEGALIPFSQLPTNPRDFTRVTVQGSWLTQQAFLLENQIHDGVGGADLILPFKITNANHAKDQLLLVDYGFVARGQEKKLLPKLNSKTQHSLTGTLKYPPQHVFFLGNLILDPNAQPMSIQKIDLKLMSQLLKHPVEPFILRLAPDANSPFIRDWLTTNMPPQRHLAYAAQWFLMAAALIIGAFIFRRKQKGTGSSWEKITTKLNEQ